MMLKVFDVAAGSCNFIKTSTGKTELVDFGANSDWSPVDHVYRNYIGQYGVLDRLVLTHHHGDHLKDWDSFGQRRPNLVLIRPFDGTYYSACESSNTPEGQDRAQQVADAFASWTSTPDATAVNDTAWGVTIWHRSLSAGDADSVSDTDNATANNCSYVRLYDHAGTKILIAGDMEKEAMALLLSKNPKFKAALSGVDVLIAPHHGHRSGFCTELFEAIGRPAVVIASMMAGDNYVDSRYSNDDYVRGVSFDDGTTKRLLTTRTHGAITVESRGGGGFHVTINQR